MKLSVIICAHNEKNTILEIIKRVKEAGLPSGWEREMIVVDNCSTDGTRELLSGVEKGANTRVVYQKENHGKSHSVRKAIPFCTGDFIIPQDADLEYDPVDYFNLIKKALKEKLDVVIGSRVNKKKDFHAYKINEWGIARLTSFTNFLFHTNYTDVATCYKLMRTSKLKELKLISNGFNLDFELCAKFAKHNWRVGEINIRYEARTYKEGRKMRPLTGGLGALWTILREWITKD
jgi:glycosyltransferase involved in cell wall biosynthesis|tara:strand:+ start:2238 stop:2939 length:702 start_codon:yes stop_codon:yes gene_type:complete